jgi:hypothetical protein
MDKFISQFQEKFYYYKNMILSFPNITDKQNVNNNFELITIQKDYTSERIYIDNNLSYDKLCDHIIKTNIKKLDENLYLTINNYPYRGPNNLKSYVIWVLDNKKYNNKYIELLLIKNGIINKKKNDYIIYKNPILLKTVKSIEHHHLLLRNNNINLKNMNLKKLITILRHGPREPLIFLSKLDNSMWKSNNLDYNKQVYNAELTELGKIYSYYAGDELMNGYKNNINFSELKDNEIFIGSTNFSRTIETTKNYLSGIGLKVNYNLNIVGNMETIKKFTTELEKLDKIISLDFDKYFLEKINLKINEIFGLEIKNNKDYYNLYSVISIYKLHKILLPIEWTDELDLKLKDITINYYNKLFKNELSILIIDELLDIIVSLLNNEEIKFSVICSHDIILMAFLKVLKPKTIYNIPDFCSLIRLELWSSNNLEETNNLLRIYYDSIIVKEIII